MQPAPIQPARLLQAQEIVPAPRQLWTPVAHLGQYDRPFSPVDITNRASQTTPFPLSEDRDMRLHNPWTHLFGTLATEICDNQALLIAHTTNSHTTV